MPTVLDSTGLQENKNKQTDRWLQCIMVNSKLQVCRKSMKESRSTTPVAAQLLEKCKTNSWLLKKGDRHILNERNQYK